MDQVFLSRDFAESAGVIIVNRDNRQICLLERQSEQDDHPKLVLPKNRRYVNETRIAAAARVAWESAGIDRRILDISIKNWQIKTGEDPETMITTTKHHRTTDPFSLETFRMQGVLHLVWWYIGAVKEDSDVKAPDARYKVVWQTFHEAYNNLHFDSDRKVVGEAFDVYRDTESNSS